MIEALRKVISRMHYSLEVMMAEHGVIVDHRWVLKIVPALASLSRLQETRLPLAVSSNG
jgi:hypothetical protein